MSPRRHVARSGAPSAARLGLLIALVALAAACGGGENPGMGDIVTTDSAVGPGTVFRYGPATEAEMASPPSAPIVEGDSGQLTIHRGFFGIEPCARPLSVHAARTGDTIQVRIVSGPDTTLVGPCTSGDRRASYALLVGPFEPGDYTVHVIHDGDRARATPLDTIYDEIRILPPRRR